MYKRQVVFFATAMILSAEKFVIWRHRACRLRHFWATVCTSSSAAAERPREPLIESVEILSAAAQLYEQSHLTRSIALSCGIKNIAGMFFGLVTKPACDRQTDRRTDGQNHDSQDRASIAASRGKNWSLVHGCRWSQCDTRFVDV